MAKTLVEQTEEARLAMLKCLGTRSEDDLKLDDPYWELRAKFHQLVHLAK